MRLVTCIEVFVRGWVGELVDHGEPYRSQADKLSIGLKFDYLLSATIDGKTLTLGDVVSHGVSFNSFHQIAGIFDKLLDGQFVNRLGVARDRARVEIHGLDDRPIIENLDAVCQTLTRLYEVRHILTHELPAKRPYTSDELSSFFSAAMNFLDAADEVLTTELHGDYPLTQAAMNMEAAADAEAAKQEMSDLLRQVEQLSDVDGKLLSASQKAWEAYCTAEAELHASLVEGGTMRPTIYCGEVAQMARERTARLRWWVERALRGI